MKKNTLYVYTGSTGEIWSSVLLPMDHKTMTQIIADDGMILTDGTTYTNIIDVTDTDAEKWSEVVLTDDIKKKMMPSEKS